jgi:hypothetical protein
LLDWPIDSVWAIASSKKTMLSWLLVAIAESDLRGKLAFKGGTALKRCYYPDYRFSEDLDFTLHVDLSHADLIGALGSLFPWLSRQVNITLTMGGAEQSTLGSTALLIDYVGPLRARLAPGTSRWMSREANCCYIL